jgi:hypothetical protein
MALTALTWQEYIAQFDIILQHNSTNTLYNNPDYLNYVKLNKSRMSRWLKSMQIPQDLVEKIKHINQPQEWLLIAEPWCGDAAHNNPFIYAMSELNENIDLKLFLRDDNLELMDQYLTNGGRSIPKLIVRDKQGHDLLTWGPRPQDAQDLLRTLKNNEATLETIMNELQQWYNTDKGEQLFKELNELL